MRRSGCCLRPLWPHQLTQRCPRLLTGFMTRWSAWGGCLMELASLGHHCHPINNQSVTEACYSITPASILGGEVRGGNNEAYHVTALERTSPDSALCRLAASWKLATSSNSADVTDCMQPDEWLNPASGPTPCPHDTTDNNNQDMKDDGVQSAAASFLLQVNLQSLQEVVLLQRRWR